ncbi:Zn-ribbon-containing protein [Agarivorans sp. 1_MG-2023]|uniref:Zn-ribbon-containing protein n=1 Tax=Agarivorans sp. 1_MG-2023 TaxID=3062634 RepID=UPI0026E142CB|nr:Zn-ribbon-containing protein [Agarivorans sp. 1_MG-2023]MDO6765038.1 Zn-ribbon-containing protein [Agarivorans sp. 1_MG-2023]
MYLTTIEFECYADTTISQAEKAINQVLDCWRYNGQIIGREFPVVIKDATFSTRVVCPEENSLLESHQSAQVKRAKQALSDVGLLSPKIKSLGRDINSDDSDLCESPSWQVLYTNYLQSCSPLRCGDHFTPIPLYHLPAVANGDHKQLVKWQEDWSACDQLQMNGSILEHGALVEMSSTKSRLFKRGSDLCKRLEYLTKTPTYLYLYRVGGESLSAEKARACPSCGGQWRLEEVEHDIFDFKCDSCRLVSNISWDFKR